MNIHDDVDERIRAALRAAALQIDEADLRAVPAPSAADNTGPAQHRARWLAPLLAAAAVIGLVIATTVIASSPSAHRITPGGPTNSVAPTPLASDTVAPTETRPPETRPPDPSRTPAPTVTASKPPGSGASAPPAIASCALPVPACHNALQSTYEPLWPFPDYPTAKAWQDASKNSGAQPWHSDAGQTALLFARNYLGFTDITTVTSTTTDQDGVQVGVGYPNPNGVLHTAALLHLVRFGEFRDDTTAGWEVVGSEDTDFSLEQPTYGSQVNSPMTVGGHLTGVDENIVVDVKNLSGSVLTSTSLGLPAGGQNSPWHQAVSFRASGVLTVVAFTGGHLTQHERFAIQGVHT